MASLTSLVSAGSGVWLSKGMMATVLMFGRPPPANPYQQPASTTLAALAATAPDRRRDRRRRIHPATVSSKRARHLRKFYPRLSPVTR